MQALADRRCPICEQALPQVGRCGNWWCRTSPEARYFDGVRAIAVRSGVLLRAINSYKYDGARGWAAIFGRVLVGYLDHHAEAFARFDYITPSPTFTGSGARRSWDHIALILERAAIEAAGRWPFDVDDPRLIIKNQETSSLVNVGAYERERIAEHELRPALRVPRPERVEGTRIAVLDDVFTRGTTLREIALVLKREGAIEVSGLVLARQPWGAA